jgi:hypothetical protein
MPQSTDLVTDLPADFETFGQAVATSMADLLGGTSGQILSKASNTDMDFTWVTTDDANAIQNSIVDAKGDIVAASANDTPARLAVGSNGETLVADSSTSTGLRYTAGTVQENPVLNSAFQVWQRGTTGAGSATAFVADRWNAYRAVAGSTFSRQVTGDTTNLPFIQYCQRVQRDNGNTSTSALFTFQNLESINSIPFVGKTVVLSFYARAGANFSSASSILGANLISGTGTDQSLAGGYTGQANVVAQNATLTTTWQRFSYSGTVGSTATQLGLRFDFTPVGTAGAADYYEITGVQVDIGSVALPFRTYAGTIQGELAACMRYYERITSGSTNGRMGSGIASSATAYNPTVYFTVPKRIAPTTADYANLTTYDSGIRGLSTLAYGESTNNSITLACTVASGLTTGRGTELISSATGGYIGISAEL